MMRIALVAAAVMVCAWVLGWCRLGGLIAASY
jgi:hypothetical protein